MDKHQLAELSVYRIRNYELGVRSYFELGIRNYELGVILN